MKQWKRMLSMALVIAMVLGMIVIQIPIAASAAGGGILDSGGHMESAYVEWDFVSGASGYNVYVKATSASSWTQLDNELIRQYPDRMRADAVGLKAGTYQMKVVPLASGQEQSEKALTTGNLSVAAHKRDGYAFYGGMNIGAYNDDGTLKSDAVVVYITADNVNTVTLTIGTKSYTGIQKLCKEYARTTTEPLCIRIIGEVPIPSATTNGQVEVKGNLTNVTIEGIGEDATCNGWGFKLSGCENVELRNIGFMNNDSSEGDSVTLQNATRVWVHNCDFFYGLPGSDADQVKGDGALDTKHSTYVTHSYNHFWDCGKVNLQGSGSSDTSNYITYHHNWYDHSDSRHPRIRIATVHVYNNFYDGNAGYGVGSTLDSDVFVENNYFRNCDRPMLISDQGSDTTETMSGEAGGMIKAYGNIIIGARTFITQKDNATNFDAVVVDNRNDTVPSSYKAVNGGATYNNFDTASNFYDYSVMDAADVPAHVEAYAGRVGGGDFQWVFNDEVDDFTDDVNTALKSAVLAYETTLVSIGGNSVETGGGETEPTTHSHSYNRTLTKAATCTENGYYTYSCACGDSYTEVISAKGHSYVEGKCTACGATDSDGEDTTTPSEEPGEDPSEPSTPVVSSKYIHNFTVNGTSSDFYTITGTLSTSKGSTSYNGLSLTQCLMLDKTSSTVKFTAPSAGTLTMVFGGNTSDRNKKVMVNGTGYTIDSNNQVSIDIAAGSYTITRGSSSINLWYIEYATEAAGGDVHTHSYSKVITAPTCTAQGFTTYTCTCGDSYVADYVAATGHSYNSAVTTAATCESAGVRTYTCANCGDSYTESIPATGHSYSTVVTAPTCTAGGHTTYTCSKCGNSYQGAFTSALGHSYNAVVTAPTCTANGYTTYTCSACGDSYQGAFTSASGHNYVNGTCTVCGASDPSFVELFDLYGSNVNLGNDLTMNFYVSVNNINGEAYYIEIVKEYDDGSTVTTTVPYAQWESYYGVMWKVSLEGMAAKEMADKIYVTVYTTAGVQVSNTWTDSIRDYCIRQLNNASQSGAYTLLADMLNYGAAAQTQFGYNVDDLANSTMTAAQKAYATQSFNLSNYENNQVKGTNYIGSSLSLETNIQLTIYFNKLSSSNGLRAVVSYTDHLGEAKSYEVAEADFTTLAGIYYGIVVDTLVAADVCQVVSVALYDGSTLVGYASDSMESYAVRQSGDMNIALMKFTLSAYEFLH